MSCQSGCSGSSPAVTAAAMARWTPPRSVHWSRRRSSLQTALGNLQGGGYSFGDTVGLSTRTHIENTIEDLRLAPQANQEAKRIASAFADELEERPTPT